MVTMDREIFNQLSNKSFRKDLRNEMPSAERILWNHLRKRQLLDFKFRRQHGVGPYVVDFFCPALRLVVEVDGDSHFRLKEQEHDKKRDEYLKHVKLHVVRFTNDQIYQDLEEVLRELANKIGSLRSNPL